MFANELNPPLSCKDSGRNDNVGAIAGIVGSAADSTVW